MLVYVSHNISTSVSTLVYLDPPEDVKRILEQISKLFVKISDARPMSVYMRPTSPDRKLG